MVGPIIRVQSVPSVARTQAVQRQTQHVKVHRTISSRVSPCQASLPQRHDLPPSSRSVGPHGARNGNGKLQKPHSPRANPISGEAQGIENNKA